MDRKQKNLWGALWFIPSIYSAIRWGLGVVGDVDAAFSVFQTKWITIDWIVVSHLLALVGVWWFLFINFDLFIKWNKARLDEKKNKWNMTGAEAINYLLHESHRSKTFGHEEPEKVAIAIFWDVVKNGKLPCAAYRPHELEPIKVETISNGTLQWEMEDEKLNTLVIKLDDKKIITGIYCSKKDVLNIWPRSA